MYWRNPRLLQVNASELAGGGKRDQPVTIADSDELHPSSDTDPEPDTRSHAPSDSRPHGTAAHGTANRLSSAEQQGHMLRAR